MVGLPAAVPLGGVGSCFALVSSGLIIASKKLDSKFKKKPSRDCYTCYISENVKMSIGCFQKPWLITRYLTQSFS